MYYKQFQDLSLSALGLGCMRLPTVGGRDAEPDEAQVREMVAYAMEKGINYYDTAWGYHAGNSELVMGKVLSDYPRERFYLASKFPGYSLPNMDKVEEIFEKQLEKCRVEYFDFYLFHNVCEMNIDAYLEEKYGIRDYLIKQKAAGRIRHLGFSVHGNYDTFLRFLDAYGGDMEFCQIQMNYLDYTFQEANRKMEELKKRGIPAWVMEPVRGGKLAKLDAADAAILRECDPGLPDVEWAFRFLQGFPEITVTLSGMSNLEQLRENIGIYEKCRPLNEKEAAALRQTAAKMLGVNTVPCTACRYCTAYCPMELDIPELLRLYNEHAFSGGGFIAPMALNALPEDKKPSACIGCRSCEAVCPQQIKISETFADFVKKLKK